LWGGDIAVQIENWGKLAGNIRVLDTIGLTRNDCTQKKMALYEKTGNREKVIEMEKAIADTHLKQGNLDLAETELLSVLEKYKSIGFKRLHYTYNLLSSVNSFKGNYNTALHYALLTIESMRNNLDTAAIVNYYCHLAGIYDELGQEEKSAENFSIALNRQFTNPIDFYDIRNAGMYARVLIKQNKVAQALSFIKDFATRYPPVDNYGKASLARTLAWCYRSNGNLAKSEEYILEMIALVPSLLKNNEITEEVEYDLGSYFLDKKDFTTASIHFNHAFAEASYVNSVFRKKDVYLMLFKTDSSLGNYVQAIQHLNQYKRLNDSIFTVVKNRQLQEVQVQYETEKKDKDLSLKDKNIQLLTKQSQLQLANLRTEKNTRNMVLVCTGLLILLLALGYNRYKLKQKNNIQLEEQQKNIQEKNIYLQHLLQEKEWLVKEIHHRVKNNFHTVMGLLGTQSGYLKNEEAIAAMAESQQRIQAMSLIHQKLYQSENMSDIDMADYIYELVDYLKDSLNTGRRIQFHFQLDRIGLAVYHAVAIGLILNETITNAIKYAFPGNRNGNIRISFTADHDNENSLLLVVTDDGTGLPAGFNNSSNDTMGMNLMKGLARDIDGEFTIQGTDGTTVKIAFTYHRDTPNDHRIAVKETHQVV
jgi:two-component sensor histidine kinase